MEDNNIEVATLFDNGDLKVTLNYLKGNVSAETRIYFWDSDGQYIDDWDYDAGENIQDSIEALYDYANNGFENFFETAFDKEVIYDASIKEYKQAVKDYGEELINRVGNIILITNL